MLWCMSRTSTCFVTCYVYINYNMNSINYINCLLQASSPSSNMNPSTTAFASPETCSLSAELVAWLSISVSNAFANIGYCRGSPEKTPGSGKGNLLRFCISNNFDIAFKWDWTMLGSPRESSAAVEGWLLQSCRLVCGRISTLLVKVGDRGSSWDDVVRSWLFTDTIGMT